MSNATQTTTATKLSNLEQLKADTVSIIEPFAAGASDNDTLAQCGGALVVGTALSLVGTAIAAIVSCTLIGFWMTLLLAALSWIISMIMSFLIPTIMDHINDATYAAIGRSVGGAANTVIGWFASSEEPAPAAI
jgi:hypothetical protein